MNREHHTLRHAADPGQEEPSGLRIAIGNLIGKEPLPGREYNRRAKIGAAATIATASLVTYGILQGAEQIGDHLSDQEPAVVTTTEITTDPISLSGDVYEIVEEQGFDPADVSVSMPDFATAHQGQDPRKASYANETYEVRVFEDGTVTVTPVQ